MCYLLILRIYATMPYTYICLQHICMYMYAYERMKLLM